MVNQQLMEYVKEEISKGTSNESIKSVLLQNGWSSDNIDETFAILQSPPSSAPIAPPSSAQAPSPVTATQASDTAVDSALLNKQMHLHPKAVWLFFLKQSYTWLLIGLFTIFEVVTTFLNSENSLTAYIVWILIIFVIMIAISYGVAKLSYHFYKYELTEHEYKAERGIIWKRYISIPYTRIQNVDIYRGVLSRILGLSDLQIQTAGQSAIGSEGSLPALGREHAELIRDALMVKARTAKGGGI